jgi:hydroxymethylglutaryl-CoA lyase
MTWPAAVRVREVGPRDGVQSEKADIATADKIRLIDSLSATGVKAIEAVSFVSPKAIPQMADARDVWAGIDRRSGVFYSALVPNRKGAETAAEAGADGMQVFLAASESYNLKNVNKSVQDSVRSVEEVVEVAAAASIPVEGTISTAFGCPYEGDVAPERVVEVSRWMMDTGVASISYGDTCHRGPPRGAA